MPTHHIHAPSFSYTHTHTHLLYMHAHIHTHTRPFLHTHTLTHMHVYVNAHIHRHTHSLSSDCLECVISRLSRGTLMGKASLMRCHGACHGVWERERMIGQTLQGHG